MPTCYDPASRPCASGATPGARELLRAVLEHPDFEAGRSGGIFACRSVRGASAPSVHGNGRAVDLMFPGAGHPQGTALKNLLVKTGRNRPDLGIQFIIWNRRKYGCVDGFVERAYGGQNPHTDHVHVELTKAASKTLTLAALRQAWGASPPTQEEPDMAEGAVAFPFVERAQKNHVIRLNPLPTDVRWWINLSARDDAKGYACFLKRDGSVAWLAAFDFTSPGGDPDQEWTIGPTDAEAKDVVAFCVYVSAGADPVGVTGYWRRP